MKWVVTFNLAAGTDDDAFEAKFHRAYLAKAYRLPGLRKVEVAKAVCHLQGAPACYRMVELYFDRLSDARRASESKAGRAFTRGFVNPAIVDLKMTICRVE